ncbi:MAG: hypothetical protein GFH27_549287n100 [Chloroflexi bacterium AL-W]|nr:hypothetical protein [Chloroflexi bacterium AL-N1]NOK66374.1 hypothetical protein [Chloroflexi bacterium AL-N10]NOK71762.1 hypothetical protein [Chloroflexi bacterium AL-N5]NOK81019.1 hypothetical protein [Chloroflexi bacterium AL-W]NOK89292.1 hypothetical protein [Chloroflexi bacterium AL-N15]
MRNMFAKFTHTKPRCLQSFQLEDTIDINGNWVTGPEFLSKRLRYAWGNSKLNVLLHIGKI